jgi:hypothetical protein
VGLSTASAQRLRLGRRGYRLGARRSLRQNQTLDADGGDPRILLASGRRDGYRGYLGPERPQRSGPHRARMDCLPRGSERRNCLGRNRKGRARRRQRRRRTFDSAQQDGARRQSARLRCCGRHACGGGDGWRRRDVSHLESLQPRPARCCGRRPRLGDLREDRGNPRLCRSR